MASAKNTGTDERKKKSGTTTAPAKKASSDRSTTQDKQNNSNKNNGKSTPASRAHRDEHRETPREKADAPKKPRERDPHSVVNQILPFVFFVSAIIALLVLVMQTDAIVVKFLREFLLGLFSVAAFILPAALVLLGVFWQSDVMMNRITLKLWCAGISLVLSSMLAHMILHGEANYSIGELYTNGITYQSGGVIGGLLASLFITAVDKVISYILIISALFISSLLLFGLTPKSVYVFFAYKCKVSREKRREKRSLKALAPLPKPAADRIKQLDDPAAKKDEEDVPEENGDDAEDDVTERSHRRKFDPDIDISADKKASKKSKKAAAEEEEDLDQDVIDQKIFEEVMRRTRERYGEQSFDADEYDDVPEISYGAVSSPASADATDAPVGKKLTPVSDSLSSTGEIDLSKIFIDPDKIELLNSSGGVNTESSFIEAECEIMSEPDMPPFDVDEPNEPEVPVPVYEFPPLSLLTTPEKPSAADLDELKANASKLVDTLRSFNVKTRVSDVFRGPTITRYELTPESGTRVRSIANLSDDIALGLAVPNVRIEAPIPGKAAVGIEVPNKKRENVYLRSLLENEDFENSSSRLTCALGADVAGSPIYCDIAKMPHLLVAGATGTGKSVCINSIITSLLYKSTPQEIRLIMIDPKKVELTIYNGIPHLHVPVVSDVKKAAGTLAWAVTEMERRYELIESVGARNIQSYNEITYNDPEKEFMPQMVIIIDEFADLMMTVPDDVETSVCRIAQMGRAAGIHLIIGTQRPSVNVVTGLIKANIPSRIAFTMSSQVDSRTVIDVAGAEKLLGRGDMLYTPVGMLKPLRVQGAFVSEAEVQKVIDFLKGICPNPQYDSDAIDGIEAAAARCGQGKGRGGDSGGGEAPVATDDPMLRQALELAVETGKISTSLIQRRLSLGYGRAAKLIDTMEARGFVSAPDGQRPRDVLITRQQYQELVLHDELG